MPLYEYKCEKCGEVFEVMQKFSDPPLSVHGNGCGGAVVRLLSTPAFQFKGTGWYITDYARKSSSDSTSKGNGNGSKSSGSGSATESASKSAASAPDKK
jgi:putative FmdB family regulatory protein